MSIVIVETLSDVPLTPEEPTANDLQLLSCLAERNGSWRYSLISSDRLRMICTFDAPDAEVVRESYRKTKVTFSRVWSGDIIRPQGIQPQQNPTELKVLEGSYPDGLTPEQWDEMNQSILSYYTKQGINWVQSYISSDRSRMVFEFNAPDIGVIQNLCGKVGLSLNHVWSAKIIATLGQ